MEAKKRRIGFGKLPCVDFPNIHSWELLQSVEPDTANGIGMINVEHTFDDLLELIQKVS